MILENKFGYILKISYDGNCFDSFDEAIGKKSVKLTLKNYLLSKGVKLLKGLSQAARTDAKVSANENYIYFNAKRFNMKILDLNKNIEGLEILEIKEVSKNLIISDLVEYREYIYSYPKKLLKLEDFDEIQKRCEIINQTDNFYNFTTHKGKKMLNHIRKVEVKFIDFKLYFKGESFLPQQVRMMSGYILKNKIKSLEAKYLVLNKIVFKVGEVK